MRKKILQTLMVCLTLLVVSCREEDLDKQENPTITANEKASKVSLGAYQSEMPYNINVVYFIPSNISARPEYERRVSEFMIAAQEYYRQNMYNWGYGSRSFGLLKNPATNRIKINVIHGALPMTSYSYSAGGGRILSEVSTWFASHPTDRTSEHTIIFTAVPTPETEIPYYGLGTTCFVGDNEAWDCKNLTLNNAGTDKIKAYLGGFFHELGHAMNLDHDALPKSQENVAGYGTSLMGIGNYTYGYSSTILTKSCCAVLNNCQLFSTTTKPAGYFYKFDGDFNITSITSSYSNGRINISGTYTSSAPLNGIISYFSPNDDYYAPSGLVSNTSNTFSTFIDVADLHSTDSKYQFYLRAVYTDGSILTSNIYSFTFANNIPVYHFGINQTGWAASSSSQYSIHPASLAIDGNISTYWHSNYVSGSVQTAPIAGQPQNFPYYFDINIGSIKQLSGLYFTQHQGLARTAKNLSVWTRATVNDGWKYEGNYNLTNTTPKQYIDFPQKESARYIRIRFISSFDGLPYVAMPEIGAYENKLF
ncbi:discoidin domain-containing protein [Chryseobacterium sp. SIMBA_038]|uniref:discoidin domain-containing protein n=1 Tax=Chryseobacterium sp. SIMBA_038 TaxID=3085780 RepID=UPI00397B98DE